MKRAGNSFLRNRDYKYSGERPVEIRDHYTGQKHSYVWNDGSLSPSGGTDFVNAHFSYSHDALGRKTWEVSRGHLFERFPGGAIATRFKYDVSGRLQSAVTYAGPETTESGATVPGRRFEFSYDHAGNLTSKQVEGSAFSHSPNKAHAYSSRQNPSTVSYTGMAGSDLQLGGQTAHQRLGDYFRHSPSVANTSGPVRHQLQVSSGEQSVTLRALAPRRSESFAYDKAGNLVSDSQWSYSYDALNRLIMMEQKAASGLPSADRLRLRFAYDEQNRRVEKVVEKLSSNQLLSRERYLYNGWNLVATLDAANLSNIKMESQYFWRTGSESTGAFGLLMIAGDHDGNASTPVKAFYTGYDGRGNLAVLAEQGRGVAAAAFEYSPFGERLRGEASQFLPDLDSLGAHFGFATQFTDRESGLIYFGNRYYHPGLGRFITRDPIREAGGLNLYAYAGNDPVNQTDYRGLCPSAYDSSGSWWSSLWSGFTGIFSGGSEEEEDIPPANETIELDPFIVTASRTVNDHFAVQSYVVDMAVHAINSVNQSVGRILEEVVAGGSRSVAGSANDRHDGDARKPQQPDLNELKKLPCEQLQRIFEALDKSFNSKGGLEQEHGLLFGTAKQDIYGYDKGQMGAFPTNRFLLSVDDVHGNKNIAPALKKYMERPRSKQWKAPLTPYTIRDYVDFYAFMHVQRKAPNFTDYPESVAAAARLDAITSIVLTPERVYFMDPSLEWQEGGHPDELTMPTDKFRSELMEGCK